MKKKIPIGLFVFLGVFVVGMVLSALYDLQISKYVARLEAGEYFSNDEFSRGIEIFGEMPLYLFLCYAAAVVFWNAFYFGKSGWKYFLCVISILGVAYLCFYIPNRTHEYFSELNEVENVDFLKSLPIDILVGLCLGFLAIFGVKFTGKSNLKKQLSFAVVIFFVAACSQFFTQGLKFVNKRVRFRAMNAQGDFDYFTPWYVINGFPENFKNLAQSLGTNDAIRSFPSGHTTAAGITFSLIAVPYISKTFSDKTGKGIFYVISIAYTGLVAYGRMRMGAHYLSDVIFGGGLAFVSAYLAVWLVYVKKAIKPINNYCFQSDEE